MSDQTDEQIGRRYTPGPWKVEGEFDAEVPVTIVGQDDRMIIEIEPYFLGEWEPHEIANARLIAAAPELLEACKAELASVEDDWRISARSFAPNPDEHEAGVLAEYRQVIGKLKRAIAKAEGK